MGKYPGTNILTLKWSWRVKNRLEIERFNAKIKILSYQVDIPGESNCLLDYKKNLLNCGPRRAEMRKPFLEGSPVFVNVCPPPRGGSSPFWRYLLLLFPLLQEDENVKALPSLSLCHSYGTSSHPRLHYPFFSPLFSPLPFLQLLIISFPPSVSSVCRSVWHFERC